MELAALAAEGGARRPSRTTCWRGAALPRRPAPPVRRSPRPARPARLHHRSRHRQGPRRRPDGRARRRRLRVLVHIADVAAACGWARRSTARRGGAALGLPAGPRRADAAARASSGLCSLVPDRPRDTVTVELVFDGRRERGGRPRFSRAQIVSRPPPRLRGGGAGPGRRRRAGAGGGAARARPARPPPARSPPAPAARSMLHQDELELESATAGVARRAASASPGPTRWWRS